VLLIAAVAVVVGIVFVATGRGGEMAYEQADHAPLDLGPVSATDVVLLRPPTAMWGYNMQVTDEALDRIATAIRDRDVLIVALEQQVADLKAAAGAPGSPGEVPAATPGAAGTVAGPPEPDAGEALGPEPAAGARHAGQGAPGDHKG
jgi:hypothetical protein